MASSRPSCRRFPRESCCNTVISHHLLAPVRDVGAHRGQPFQGREVPGCRAVSGCINDRPLLIQVLHPLLGEGRPDDVAGQVLHSRIIVGGDAVAAEDPRSGRGQAVEAGMPPRREHGDQLLRDLSPWRISCRHNVERSFYLSRGIF